MVAATAYGVAFRVGGLVRYLWLVLSTVLFHWLLGGVLAASIGSWIANKHLLQHHQHSVEQTVRLALRHFLRCDSPRTHPLLPESPLIHNLSDRCCPSLASMNTYQVEWLYAFDIHCNAFFLFFLIAYVGQFFLLPPLLSTSFVSLVLSNSLHALAISVYFYVTHLGYRALPFLRRTEVRICDANPEKARKSFRTQEIVVITLSKRTSQLGATRGGGRPTSIADPSSSDGFAYRLSVGFL